MNPVLKEIREPFSLGRRIYLGRTSSIVFHYLLLRQILSQWALCRPLLFCVCGQALILGSALRGNAVSYAAAKLSSRLSDQKFPSS